MMAIHPDTLHDELKSIQKIVNQWETYVDKTQLPGIDVQTPDAEEKMALLIRRLSGEMMLVAGKCHNLSTVLTEL